ncbi:MAG TPA: hypothetical protein VHN11_06720 [Xanthobacteraceae bacterium]|jgi:hypothetical protein|nr:hypothetical protein [Xanthobacteraceae bacterium]
MPETALNEPIHLRLHPDEPIRSLDAAAKVIHRHSEGRLDPESQEVLRMLADASTPEAIARAGSAFKEWARHRGLLLVPPEDQEK